MRGIGRILLTEAPQLLAEVDELNSPEPLGDLGMLTPDPTVLLIPVVSLKMNPALWLNREVVLSLEN